MLIASYCVGCRQCRPYCPVGAIVTAPDGRRSTVDQDKCVECGACLRAAVCPVNAVVRPELTYPRTLRSVFSDVTSPHKSTGVLGRGTEEMKTNDVTGRLRAHRVNVSVELGRPGISASFADVEVLSRAIAAFGVHFQEENPVTNLMTDVATGQLRPEILGERVLSALIEFDVAEERAPALVTVLKEAAEIRSFPSEWQFPFCPPKPRHRCIPVFKPKAFLSVPTEKPTSDSDALLRR